MRRATVGKKKGRIGVEKREARVKGRERGGEEEEKRKRGKGREVERGENMGGRVRGRGNIGW